MEKVNSVLRGKIMPKPLASVELAAKMLPPWFALQTAWQLRGGSLWKLNYGVGISGLLQLDHP